MFIKFIFSNLFNKFFKERLTSYPSTRLSLWNCYDIFFCSNTAMLTKSAAFLYKKLLKLKHSTKVKQLYTILQKRCIHCTTSRGQKLYFNGFPYISFVFFWWSSSFTNFRLWNCFGWVLRFWEFLTWKIVCCFFNEDVYVWTTLFNISLMFIITILFASYIINFLRIISLVYVSAFCLPSSFRLDLKIFFTEPISLLRQTFIDNHFQYSLSFYIIHVMKSSKP